MAMYWQRFKTLEQRFWEKTLIGNATDCWKWIGSRGPYGRGRMWDGEKNEMAPRIAYRLMRGEIPAGMQALHRCDNPNCVNPKHLFVGTQKENVADMIAKGRRGSHGAQPGENHPLAKLTAEQVSEIRASSNPSGEIAKAYGISRTQVWRIRRGERWASARHV